MLNMNHLYANFVSRKYVWKCRSLNVGLFFRADGGVGPRVSVRIASCPRYFHRGCGDLWCRRSLDVLGSNSRTTPPPGERYLGMSPWCTLVGLLTKRAHDAIKTSLWCRFDIMMTLLSRRVSAAKLLPGFKHCNPFEDRMPIRGWTVTRFSEDLHDDIMACKWFPYLLSLCEGMVAGGFPS